MAQSAYIHIPFCRSKCKYCSFISYSKQSTAVQKRYIQTLLKEIEYFYKDEILKTFYIGGGTPSLLDIEDLESILKSFNFAKDAEITIEINPETVNPVYLQKLNSVGFNRISIGVQSLDNNILKSIGRIHDASTALQTIIAAQKAGFKNISTDFIYGLPEQTLDSFVKDLIQVVDLGIKHISLYGLKIEEGCYFYQNMPSNLPDDDMQADMYLAAIETLEKRGFSHYEISNFAIPSFESRHNMNYWGDGEYYGFGAAAHGYIGGVRYSNFCGLNEYEKDYTQKEFLRALSQKERLQETIFLGFRRGDGINIADINEKFCIDFDKVYSTVLNKYLSTGHIVKTLKGYKLSDNGFLLSNIILADFI